MCVKYCPHNQIMEYHAQNVSEKRPAILTKLTGISNEARGTQTGASSGMALPTILAQWASLRTFNAILSIFTLYQNPKGKVNEQKQ